MGDVFFSLIFLLGCVTFAVCAARVMMEIAVRIPLLRAFVARFSVWRYDRQKKKNQPTWASHRDWKGE